MAGLESGQRADAREPGLRHYGRNDPGRGDLGPSPAGKGRFDCLGNRECGVHLGDGGQDGSGILPILLPKVPACLGCELLGLAVISRSCQRSFSFSLTSGP